MYRSEICFLAGVHPATPTGQVPDLARLVRRAKQVLETNKERAVQSTTGDLGRGRQHWVYRRQREPCRRCRTPVRRVEVDGRGVYWCPRCQQP
jgi:endonuclease-8